MAGTGKKDTLEEKAKQVYSRMSDHTQSNVRGSWSTSVGACGSRASDSWAFVPGTELICSGGEPHQTHLGEIYMHVSAVMGKITTFNATLVEGTAR